MIQYKNHSIRQSKYNFAASSRKIGVEQWQLWILIIDKFTKLNKYMHVNKKKLSYVIAVNHVTSRTCPTDIHAMFGTFFCERQ